MIQAFRLVKRKHATTAFDGEGAKVHPGRWNSAGRRVVYTSADPALATLEILVGLQDATLLSTAYVLCSAGVVDAMAEHLDASTLPDSWQSFPAFQALKAIGDTWLESRRSVALEVPSAVVPGMNYLLNPLHPDFASVRIGLPQPFKPDPRLVRFFQEPR